MRHLLSLLRRYRCLAALPAIVWVVVKLFMAGPFLPQNTASPTDAVLAELAALGIGAAEICGVESSVTVNADTGGSGDQPVEGSHRCDWCLGFGSLSMPEAPATAVDVLFDGKTLKFEIAAAATLACIGVLTGFHCRAPPA